MLQVLHVGGGLCSHLPECTDSHQMQCKVTGLVVSRDAGQVLGEGGKLPRLWITTLTPSSLSSLPLASRPQNLAALWSPQATTLPPLDHLTLHFSSDLPLPSIGFFAKELPVFMALGMI